LLVIVRDTAGKVLYTTDQNGFARVPVKDEVIRIMGVDGEFAVNVVIHTGNHGVELIVRRI